MTSLTRNILIVAAITIAVLATILLMPASRQAMPVISFTDIDGEQHQLTDYQGQPILMIFWATDCPGCIKELPDLIALHDAYADKGLKMISVAMPHDTPDHIMAMRAEKKIPYPIVWDQDSEIGDAFGNVRVTPTHFLISPQGEIVMRKIGVLKPELVKQTLATMGLM